MSGNEPPADERDFSSVRVPKLRNPVLWMMIPLSAVMLFPFVQILWVGDTALWDSLASGRISPRRLAVALLPLGLILVTAAGLVQLFRQNRGRLAFAAGDAGIMLDPHRAAKGVRWDQLQSLTAEKDPNVKHHVTLFLICRGDFAFVPIARIQGDSEGWQQFEMLAERKGFPVGWRLQQSDMPRLTPVEAE